MKLKYFFIVAAAILFLSACGSKNIGESITLVNHENKEVTFPQEKPALFFFVTTYT